MSQNTQSNRQAWLEEAVRQVTPIFLSHGYSVPDINISCGFPSTGQRSPRVGECWSTRLCSSGLNEIFISPILDNTEEVLGIIIHELVHAVDDCKSGHGAAFKKIATTIGLTGKMIHAHPNDELGKLVKLIVADIGPYPHKRLIPKTRITIKRQRPYAECSECGYRVPMLKKFLDVGPPICPKDNIMMMPEGQWD
jgi:hypothetical protein